MQLSDFVAQPCKSRIAFEFVPKKKQQLDLQALADKLRITQIFVETETPYLLMLRVSSHPVSLFRNGKIIVKDTNDKGEARIAAEALLGEIMLVNPNFSNIQISLMISNPFMLPTMAKAYILSFAIPSSLSFLAVWLNVAPEPTASSIRRIRLYDI